MRVDKYLKVSRLLKRRSVACDACSEGLIFVNGKQSKPGARLKLGDILDIKLGSSSLKVKVVALNEKASKAQANTLYEIMQEN